jgi:hypothetical protein
MGEHTESFIILRPPGLFGSGIRIDGNSTGYRIVLKTSKELDGSKVSMKSEVFMPRYHVTTGKKDQLEISFTLIMSLTQSYTYLQIYQGTEPPLLLPATTATTTGQNPAQRPT